MSLLSITSTTIRYIPQTCVSVTTEATEAFRRDQLRRKRQHCARREQRRFRRKSNMLVRLLPIARNLRLPARQPRRRWSRRGRSQRNTELPRLARQPSRFRAAARPAPVTTRPQVQQNERPGEQPGRPPVPENRPVPQPAQRPEVVQRGRYIPNRIFQRLRLRRLDRSRRPAQFRNPRRVPNCRSDLLRNKLPDRNSSKDPRRSPSRVPRRPNALLSPVLNSSNRGLLRNPWRARRKPNVHS